MEGFFERLRKKEAFRPSYLLGIWVNPYFTIRRRLHQGVHQIASLLQGGRLLDVGCGSKPYKELFQVANYVGIDVEVSGHDHSKSEVDIFYDGEALPFPDATFDHVFSSEVLEHVLATDQFMSEISRVLKKGGYFGLTCPFVWAEHEAPYDFVRFTSFAIEPLLRKHGFDVVSMTKSSGHFETIMQMLAAYVVEECLPRNKKLKLLLTPFFVSPITIIGIGLGKILPDSQNFYHNNIVVARKV